MVVSASVSGTGAVKRPASSMHDDYTGWETAPVSRTESRQNETITDHIGYGCYHAYIVQPPLHPLCDDLSRQPRKT